MRIAVYAVMKDEAKHVERWAASAKDADVLVIADTGSTDDTVKIAQSLDPSEYPPVIVGNVCISPFRFDDGRNVSLALVPDAIDLCICLDADEVLVPGWREHLEALPPGVTRPRYTYTWNWNEDGTPGLQYMGDKIHSRHGYRWKHPVHEVMTPTTIEQVEYFCGLEIHHHADNSKPRSYLPMLEQSVREDPTDDRNAHYLAREYYYVGDPRAAAEFKRHLALPTAVWAPERAKSMSLLARCEPAYAEQWLLRAVAEDPYHRDTWFDLCAHYYQVERWQECLAAAVRCLSITERSLDYLSEAEPWGAQPYDYAAIAAFNLGDDVRAVNYGTEACRLAPTDKRMAANLVEYKERGRMGTEGSYAA